MEKLLDEYFDSTHSYDQTRNHSQTSEISRNHPETDSEEEGEIKDEYEIKDIDLTELEKICNSHDFRNLMDNFIDSGELKENYIKNNFFDDIFGNFDCDNKETSLTEIDEKDLVPSIKSEIKDCREMRKTREIIDSDTEPEENDDDDLDSIGEIDLAKAGSLLDNLLDSEKRKKRSQVETTRKGRIVDKETELEYLLPVDLEEKLSSIVISADATLEMIGTVIHRIDGMQAITFQGARSDLIYGLNTIVLDGNKRMVGMIDNIFGTKDEPCYLVMCKTDTIAASFKKGDHLFCAPNVRDAYFTAADTKEVQYNNDSDIMFSDDEKEEAYRRAMLGKPTEPNKKKKSNRKRKPTANRFCHQNRPRNPFRAVNMHPFTSQPPMSYWQAPSNSMMMMPPPPLPPMMGQYPQQNQSFIHYPPPIINPTNQCTSFEQFQRLYSSGNFRQ